MQVKADIPTVFQMQTIDLARSSRNLTTTSLLAYNLSDDMNAGLTVAVCLLVVGPISAWFGWKFFKWFIIRQELARLEAGSAQQSEPSPAVIVAAT